MLHHSLGNKKKRKYAGQKDNVKSFGAINEFRIREGLLPITRGKRKCMCCSKQFDSEDIDRIRICTLCKSLTEQGGFPIYSLVV
jgi:hypothetical protein